MNLSKNSFSRNKLLNVNIAFSAVFRFLSILVNFLMVPLVLNFLSPVKYGIWLTLSSIIGWFNLFDLGLANGLKNKLTIALSENNFTKARRYISSTYGILTIISITLFSILLIVKPHVNWNEIFKIPYAQTREIENVILVAFTFFCLRFILNTLSVVLISNQTPAVNNLIDFVGSFITLIAIFIATRNFSESLLIIAVLYSSIPVIILTFATFFLFKYKFKKIKPNLESINLTDSKNLMSLGINFFILQVAVLIIFSTDNMIITQILGPDRVTTYNIAFKYFNIPLILFSIIIQPFWAAFTEAYSLNDFDWVKKSLIKLIKYWLAIILCVLCMILTSSILYRFWIGDKIEIPFNLTILMALFVVISTWNSIFSIYLNSISKIKIQVLASIFAMTLNIPISVYFSKTLELGEAGVILGTCITLLFGAIVGPVQTFLILNNKARGIWNK